LNEVAGFVVVQSDCPECLEVAAINRNIVGIAEAQLGAERFNENKPIVEYPVAVRGRDGDLGLKRNDGEANCVEAGDCYESIQLSTERGGRARLQAECGLGE
jgi:hypothetical protein